MSDESDWGADDEWAHLRERFMASYPATTIRAGFTGQALLILGLAACQDATRPVDTTGQTTQAPIAPAGFGGPFKPRPLGTGAVRVGPPRGTVVVVGGGGQGPEVFSRRIVTTLLAYGFAAA